MIIRTAEFHVSNSDPAKCPEPVKPEYAFIGRSNVGKSSLINMLLERKNLARTSATPGKTRLINHFIINAEWYLVDLPGYGYARISKKEREKWELMIRKYFLKRPNLVNTFILVDARIEPKKADIEFINWFGQEQLPFSVVFTKADKLTANQLASNVADFKAKLSETWEELPSTVITSAETGEGRGELLSLISKGNEAYAAFLETERKE
ncbi:ribosome biogenesis GTP-binding protein YsxC/EngB [Lentimicrobium saccharophilum]|uniref:Probable GTP-binding protein EngB n=1 Tax=Lentimicrobium saccharophilum TaxID=1678841 RepID=A0A0S7C044_9BACT|nr:ribosome biogenesis GTP-binding protein YihA/YsxC [Lentimicrobium saccharophilum]GAP42496.1 ribosome biogenesis GTP-binding protein YsxC/EngB [Lentimicrobium saccharophilum]